LPTQIVALVKHDFKLRTNPQPMSIRSVAHLAALMACSTTAFAQPESPPFEDAWKFNLGIGVGSQPKFPGSESTRTSVMPVLSAQYGRYFIGGVPGSGSPAAVGAFLLRDSGWSVGVGLGANLRSPRKESDSSRLKGMGDIDKTALGSVFVNYDWRWLGVRSNIQTDIGGKNEGTTAALDLEARMPLGGGFMLSAGPGVTWADHKYQQTFFGVDSAQSAQSGLSTFDAKSGINAVRFNLGSNYKVSSRWSVGARAGLGRLTGSAADSPITERKNEVTFGLFTTYGF
jgi:outer membrane protein